ncbi:hypothetical protein OsI_12461 [Oryza sativa Indica Group]|uniref:Uncharacterized protein n=1 Tax=Oryza sativa subsp. indica TaxID=39946 RepID=A2XJ44_ORYSI|nr:hypothetical protein OsI_12461 [Oryza sativa Indica Group]
MADDAYLETQAIPNVPKGGLFKVATAANFLNQQARNQGGTRDFVWVTLRAARDFFVFGLFNPIMGCGVWAVGHVN